MRGRRAMRSAECGVRNRGAVPLLLLAIGLALAGCATEGTLQPRAPQSPGSALVREMQFPPLQVVVPRVGREVERRVLPSGIVVYLASDRSLPILDVSVIFRGGSFTEPADRPGVAQFTASLMRGGGTTSRDYAAMNEALDVLGLSVEAGVSGEALSLTLSGLSTEADRALELFVEMLRRPAFALEPFRTAQGRTIEDLRRIPENPSRLAAREFARLMYTPAHPSGRPLTPAHVAAIQPADLLAHYQRVVRPDNMFVTAVGDFPLDELFALVQRAFGDWTADGPLALPPLPQVAPRFAPGVYVLDRPLSQATLTLGHFGISRANPDRYALDLMDFILGGSGFTSRITDRVRTEEGLAYSVSASFPTGTRDLGLFRAVAQTKNENVPRVARVVLEEMARLQREPVRVEELERAKEALTHSFVFRFPSRFSAVSQLLTLEFDDEPADFYDTLLDRYRAVTVADIQRVAQQYLRPDATTILAVGDAAKFEAGLAALGSIQRLTGSDTP
jgi:zinc protease